MKPKQERQNIFFFFLIMAALIVALIAFLVVGGIGWGFFLSISAGIKDFFVKRTVPSIIFIAYVAYNECKPDGLLRKLGRWIIGLIHQWIDEKGPEDHP